MVVMFTDWDTETEPIHSIVIRHAVNGWIGWMLHLLGEGVHLQFQMEHSVLRVGQMSLDLLHRQFACFRGELAAVFSVRTVQ